jgi:Fuc2NAc and GlcNAc transferase
MLLGLLLAAAFTVSLIGSSLYSGFALRRGIIAKQNARTLHDRVVARGGGIVFATTFFLAVIVAWLLGELPRAVMLCFGPGAIGAAVAGFIDDVHDVSPMKKLLIQIGLAIWIATTFITVLYAPALRGVPAPWLLAVAFTLLFPVWLINVYNFIDGIDGLAATGAVIICVAAALVLSMSGGDSMFISLFALLAAVTVGFLHVNLPPARVFMGDAGSIFLGYCFSALILATMISAQITPWTWLCILGYFFADTTATGLWRLVHVKKWYREHRSHAYQNLARIHGSHARVTYGVALYQILWGLPLAVWSATHREWGIVAAALALAPAMLWSIRYGPRLSSD